MVVSTRGNLMLPSESSESVESPDVTSASSVASVGDFVGLDENDASSSSPPAKARQSGSFVFPVST